MKPFFQKNHSLQPGSKLNEHVLMVDTYYKIYVSRVSATVYSQVHLY